MITGRQVSVMPFMYILRCSDNTYYTGAAVDLEARIRQHNAGRGARYTRGRRPAALVYTEEFASMSEAMKREKAVKRMSRRAKERLIGTEK